MHSTLARITLTGNNNGLRLLSTAMLTRGAASRLGVPGILSAQSLSTDAGVQALTVHHDRNKKEFYILSDQAKQKAVLNYDYTNKHTVDLWHTEVPDEYRGKGVAKLLAKSAFDFVMDENLKMKVSCTYLQKYLKENGNEELLKRLA